MAANVTANLTLVKDFSTLTGFSATSDDVDSEVYVQGGSSVTYQTGKNSLEDATFSPATNIDMTTYTNPHLYWWMRCDVMPFCELLNTGGTNSGLMLRLTDGSGNYTQWHVAGRDTWSGEWKCWVVDLQNTTMVHSTSGTLSLTDIEEIIWYTDNSNSGTIRIIDNTWLDVCRFGEGLTAYGTTFDYADIEVIDQNSGNMYGVIQEIDGVYFVQGQIIIDDNGGTTTFNSTDEVLAFRDVPVHTDLYKLTYTGSGNTTVINGLNLLSSGTNNNTRPDFDASGTVGSFSISGSSMNRVGTVKFKSGQSTIGTKFNNSYLISPSTATFTSNTISNNTQTRALEVVSGNGISDCTFMDNVNATWYASAGSYDDDGNIYSGNTYDVENSSTGLVAISAINDSSVSTYINTSTGSTTITASVTLTIGGVRSASDIFIYKTSDKSLLSSADPVSVTDGSPINGVQYYKLDYSYNASTMSGIAVQVKVFNLQYVNERVDYTLSSSPATIGIQQRIDRNYKNPT